MIRKSYTKIFLKKSIKDLTQFILLTIKNTVIGIFLSDSLSGYKKVDKIGEC